MGDLLHVVGLLSDEDIHVHSIGQAQWSMWWRRTCIAVVCCDICLIGMGDVSIIVVIRRAWSVEVALSNDIVMDKRRNRIECCGLYNWIYSADVFIIFCVNVMGTSFVFFWGFPPVGAIIGQCDFASFLAIQLCGSCYCHGIVVPFRLADMFLVRFELGRCTHLFYIIFHGISGFGIDTYYRHSYALFVWLV